MPIEIGSEEPNIQYIDPFQSSSPESSLEFQYHIITPSEKYAKFLELQKDLILANLSEKEVAIANHFIKLLRLLFALEQQFKEIDPDISLDMAIDYYLGRFAAMVEISRAKGGFTARNLVTARQEQIFRQEQIEKQNERSWIHRILRR